MPAPSSRQTPDPFEPAPNASEPEAKVRKGPASPPESPAGRDAAIRQIHELAASLGKAVTLHDPEDPKGAVSPKATGPSRPSRRSPRRFRLTERDYEILKALNRYRYLRTGQVHRLLFPENRSLQMPRRRLRNLADPNYRYIRRVEPFVQAGRGSAESAWFLGKAGEEILRARGEKLLSYARGHSYRMKHHHLAHTLALSEFRLCLELALRQGKPKALITLERFISEFEMKEQASAALGKRAYILYHVLSPAARGLRPDAGSSGIDRHKSYVVHPDALVILRGRPPHEHVRQLYFAEIDLGTESLPVIRDKVIGYALFFQDNLHRKFGEFEDFRILLQTTSPRRAQNIREAVAGLRGSERLWVTDVSRITKDTLLTAPVWTDEPGKRRAILKKES